MCVDTEYGDNPFVVPSASVKSHISADALGKMYRNIVDTTVSPHFSKKLIMQILSPVAVPLRGA
jgi:hypothetical protein